VLLKSKHCVAECRRKTGFKIATLSKPFCQSLHLPLPELITLVRCLSTLTGLLTGQSAAIMHTHTIANLHCGRVDIGHAHSSTRQHAFANPVRPRCCKLPEGSRSVFSGQTASLEASGTCSKNARPSRQRSKVQTSAVFGFLRGDPAEKTRKKYQAQVDAINRLEPQMQKLSDQELADKTQQLKRKAQQNGGVDDLLVEAFAVCDGLSQCDCWSGIYHFVYANALKAQCTRYDLKAICSGDILITYNPVQRDTVA